jgi:hypothetical protein
VVEETIVRSIVSGLPSAVPLSPAKLERISLRTTPVWPSTSSPFDPSPGNGPPVSCGMRVWQAPLPTVGSVGLSPLHPTSGTALEPRPNATLHQRNWIRDQGTFHRTVTTLPCWCQKKGPRRLAAGLSGCSWLPSKTGALCDRPQEHSWPTF